MRNHGCLLGLVALTWLLTIGKQVTGDDESFIGNKTALREMLLTASGYNVKIRPNHTVTIKVGLSLMALNMMEWEDKRLTWDPSEYDNIQHIFDTEKVIWRPEIIIDNSIRDVSVISDRNLNIRVRYDGHLLWEPPKLFDTSCSVDVTHYPFDSQHCAIDVVSWAYTMDEVVLTHLTEAINMEDFVENGEWKFMKSDTTDSVVVDGNLRYSKLSFWLTFRRRPLFLMLSVLLPVALTSVLSVMVFTLPLTSGEKASYSLTVLLSYAVLQTLVSESLPSSSLNLATINLYMAAIMFMGCMSVVLTLENMWMYHHPPEPPPPPWLIKYAHVLMTMWILRSHNVRRGLIHKVAPQTETTVTASVTAIARMARSASVTALRTIAASASVTAIPTMAASASVTAIPTMAESPSVTAIPTMAASPSVTAIPTMAESPSVTALRTMAASASVTAIPTMAASASVPAIATMAASAKKASTSTSTSAKKASTSTSTSASSSSSTRNNNALTTEIGQDEIIDFELFTWQDLARLNDAFCYRIMTLAVFIITVGYLTSLLVGGYGSH